MLVAKIYDDVLPENSMRTLESRDCCSAMIDVGGSYPIFKSDSKYTRITTLTYPIKDSMGENLPMLFADVLRSLVQVMQIIV